mmetsp:Transcript_49785/g.139337  ORF Transcript_49785/g.139337 Transcript_49785/m.139337 type:complete len:213 (-) Transcript_49785:352-990(-)
MAPCTSATRRAVSSKVCMTTTWLWRNSAHSLRITTFESSLFSNGSRRGTISREFGDATSTQSDLPNSAGMLLQRVLHKVLGATTSSTGAWARTSLGGALDGKLLEGKAPRHSMASSSRVAHGSGSAPRRWTMGDAADQRGGAAGKAGVPLKRGVKGGASLSSPSAPPNGTRRWRPLSPLPRHQSAMLSSLQALGLVLVSPSARSWNSGNKAC